MKKISFVISLAVLSMNIFGSNQVLLDHTHNKHCDMKLFNESDIQNKSNKNDSFYVDQLALVNNFLNHTNEIAPKEHSDLIRWEISDADSDVLFNSVEVEILETSNIQSILSENTFSYGNRTDVSNKLNNRKEVLSRNTPIENQVLPNIISKKSLLLDAIQQNDINSLKTLIKRGAYIKLGTEDRYNLLVWAIQLGREEITRYLIEMSGEEITSRHPRILYNSNKNKRREQLIKDIVEIVMCHRVNGMQNLLDFAIQNCPNENIIMNMLRYSIETATNTKISLSSGALYRLASMLDKENRIVEEYLKRRYNCDQSVLPLLLAIETGNEENVKSLLDNIRPETVINNIGQTLLDFMILNCPNEDIIINMLQHIIKNYKNIGIPLSSEALNKLCAMGCGKNLVVAKYLVKYHGYPPLLLAITLGNEEIVGSHLHNTSPETIINNNGQTLLDFAIRNCPNKNIITKMLQYVIIKDIDAKISLSSESLNILYLMANEGDHIVKGYFEQRYGCNSSILPLLLAIETGNEENVEYLLKDFCNEEIQYSPEVYASIFDQNEKIREKYISDLDKQRRKIIVEKVIYGRVNSNQTLLDFTILNCPNKSIVTNMLQYVMDNDTKTKKQLLDPSLKILRGMAYRHDTVVKKYLKKYHRIKKPNLLKCFRP